MADSKISLMTESGALTGAELVEIVQDSGTFRTTTQAIADLGGGGGATIYNADDTIADAIRTVTLPANGTLNIGPDGLNMFRIGDDGGAYAQLITNDSTVFAAGSGSMFAYVPLYCIRPVSNFEVNGDITDSSTVTNIGSAGDIVITLQDCPIGTVARACVVDGFAIFVTPVTGTSILFWDGATTQTISDTPLSYLYLTDAGMTATFEKISATQWIVTSNIGGIFQLD